MLQAAKRAYARVQFYIKLEDEAKAMKAYNELRDLFDKKDFITVPKIANDFRFLMNRMGELKYGFGLGKFLFFIKSSTFGVLFNRIKFTFNVLINCFLEYCPTAFIPKPVSFNALFQVLKFFMN